MWSGSSLDSSSQAHPDLMYRDESIEPDKENKENSVETQEDESHFSLTGLDAISDSDEEGEGSSSTRDERVNLEVRRVTEKYSSRRREKDLKHVDEFASTVHRYASLENQHSSSYFSSPSIDEYYTEEGLNANESMDETANSSSDAVELLLPSFVQLNKLLNENGCLTLAVSSSDIDVNSRTISVFVVDSWSETTLDFIGELLEQRTNNQKETVNASIEKQKNDLSVSNLDVQIHHLKTKLESAHQNEKNMKMKAIQSDELVEKLVKQLEDVKLESRRKIKQMEQLSEEKDRKLRVKEKECNKMREKLSQLADKNRFISKKNSDVLSEYQRGAEVLSPSNKSKPFGKGKKSPGNDNAIDAQDLIHALEEKQKHLQQCNDELTTQVSSLTKQLRNVVRKNSSVEERGDSSHSSSAEDDAIILLDKVNEQAQRIRQLVHKLEMETSNSKKQNEDMVVLRQRANEMRDKIQNLELELDARPTVSQWKSKMKEMSDLEAKLHDIVMMKGESEELMNWRKHLSTSERIKADRRNHELKLWLLESLPKSVMQEVLKSLCRELDVSDVSELHPGVVKMKTVIRAVPRMEKFITDVCNFVFQKERPKHAEGDFKERPSMEDALAIIKRWWSRLHSSQKYVRFQQEVSAELRRLEAVDSENHPRHPQVSGSWPGGAGSDVSAVQKIKSLVDCQLEMFRSSKSFVDAQTFISERPEVLVNSIIEHIRYLFGIKSLQGTIPRMNEVYLFSEEMSNFISNARHILKMSNLPDATVITEIYQRIKNVEPAKAETTQDDGSLDSSKDSLDKMNSLDGFDSN